MKAIRLEEPGRFARIEIEEPAEPGPGEALVRTHRMGVCGTDIGGYLGTMPFYRYPRIPGHELGVEVLAVGDDVSNVRAGDRCCVEPYMNCGNCVACRKGNGHCCVNLEVIGVMIDGGLRERFLIRADKLHPSRTLTFEQLALVETLAIGCHAVDRSGLQPDETCLVIGAGPIGLSVIEFVRLAGAETIVLDLDERRLDFCRKTMGVDRTLRASDQVVDDLRELTDGDLPDVVLDATGNSQSMSSAFGYTAPTGRLVFVGITTKEITFRHQVFHRPEGTLLCSRNALPRDFERIIKLIEENKIDTAPWITHRTNFADVIDDFPHYTKPGSGVIKAMVEVN